MNEKETDRRSFDQVVYQNFIVSLIGRPDGVGIETYRTVQLCCIRFLVTVYLFSFLRPCSLVGVELWKKLPFLSSHRCWRSFVPATLRFRSGLLDEPTEKCTYRPFIQDWFQKLCLPDQDGRDRLSCSSCWRANLLVNGQRKIADDRVQSTDGLHFQWFTNGHQYYLVCCFHQNAHTCIFGGLLRAKRNSAQRLKTVNHDRPR